jgi:hypothetical protein
MTLTPEMILATVAPDAVDRAARLEHAIRLLRGGMACREVNSLLREQHKISYWTAWRIISMARDMVRS